MGGKSDAPDPPDYSAIAAGQIESAEMWAEVSREQLEWAREVDTMNRATLERVLGVQLPQMEMAFQNAQDDRERYESVFQPIEDDLVREFNEFDTPERREQEAAERMADVRTQFDAQKRNAQQRLEDYGIDPSQTRSQALDMGFRAQEAATAALAANQGRESVEQMGRALRGEAINIGRGLPSQIAQAQGIVNQTAGGAVGNSAATTNASVNAMGVSQNSAGVSQAGYSGATNTMNTSHNNALASNQQNMDAAGGIGELAGAAMGMFAFNEGGSVREAIRTGYADGGPAGQGAVPTGQDTIPAVLAEDEFVIPADVVKRKGTEFFDKLLDKYKDDGDYEAKRAELTGGAPPAKKPQSPPSTGGQQPGTEPEDQGSIDAQATALMDPSSTKRAMLITKGSPVPSPGILSDDVLVVEIEKDGEQAMIVTKDQQLAQLLTEQPITDELLGEILYEKPEGGAAVSDGSVFQSIDGNGQVASEFLGSRETAQQDLVKAQRLSPQGGTVRALPVQQALIERTQRRVGVGA